MPSNASEAFEANKLNVERLLEIHRNLTGDAPGRRAGVEVLNKSAIIMICACWEAFVEDLAEEAAHHVSNHLEDPKQLPDDMVTSVVASHGARKDDKAIWDMVADGWKEAINKNARYLARQLRGWGLNTPNSGNVRELMKNSIGLEDVRASWYWRSMSVEQATDKLDQLVARRSELAHGSAEAEAASKNECDGYLNHTERLVGKTESAVKQYVENLTGTEFT